MDQAREKDRDAFAAPVFSPDAGAVSGAARACRRTIGAATLLALSLGIAHASSPVEDLGSLSLEDLGKVVVTSVSKNSEPLGDAPASVYVISHDDIQRSGATSLPEILRLAPNLEVFQTSPSEYTITARGFNGSPRAQNLSDKLLVLIDGRSVYNPLYSGMYWEMQQVLPANIERIEVISGPGATMWGANAMNGVINIVTRNASQTTGGMLDLGIGSSESRAAVQYGGRLSANANYRVYATRLHGNSFDAADGHTADDGWTRSQAGFRWDWTPGRDSMTVQGDVFNGRQHQGTDPDQKISGGNLLTNWERRFDDGSSLQLLAYYDRVHRMAVPRLGGFTINTHELQIQHDFMIGSGNHVTWGAGERRNRFAIVNAITSAAAFLFRPSRFQTHVTNIFVQDQISAGARLDVVLGIKLEDDPYSGWTPMPSVRASWRINPDATIWAAASRAIRSPTPLDTQVHERVGSIDFVDGNPDFMPEKLTAHEIGYRQQLNEQAALSISAFDHRYDDLKTMEATTATIFPLTFRNGMKGNIYGVEMWGSYQPTDWWRLSAGFALQRQRLRFKPGANELLGMSQAGNDPEHHGFIRSAMNFADRWTVDADLREVAALPDPRVPGYVELNMRLGWRVNDHVGLSLSGSNLLHSWHQEYIFPNSDRIGRSVSLDVRLDF